ncbi:DUF4142 domain-containing protein [Myxococcus sp. SDU36]|uniref:DUF4142 domain-containing protein n=1 Tax=Myxococcus sp. SDU36 TaxID=2831967 RepID=UPI0025430809|nr:DUF4142 domain-containing protein [Myxococcus sp. SDU36]
MGRTEASDQGQALKPFEEGTGGSGSQGTRLLAYARKQNLTLTEPQVDTDFARTMERAEEASMAKLRSLPGPTFDRAFLAAMVGDHAADLARDRKRPARHAGLPADAVVSAR